MRLVAMFFAGILTVSMANATAQACEGHDKKAGKTEKKKEAQKLAAASFKVEGMHCEGCADKVKGALAKRDGIISVDVKVADSRVSVQYDAAKLSTEQIAKLISELGYKARAEA